MKIRAILDSNILIDHWCRCHAAARGPIRPQDVRKWAADLIALRRTDAIVTPVYVEMIAGVVSREELKLTRVFLAQFECIDERRIPEEDWEEAIRLAQRVPRDGRPRQLGDCLIRAIANRLRYQVLTHDKGFPP